MANLDEEVPYRSPVTTGPADPVSTQDEINYSTLLEVKKDFDDAIVGLSNNFNSFKLASDAPNLEAQVAGRQVAYDILEPLQRKLQSAIDDIEVKQKG